MSRLEDELKKALRRVEPPAGFADRVLARAATAGTRETNVVRDGGLGVSGMGGLRWAAACAMCIALAASGVLYEHDLQRRRGEEAKDKLMLALRITGTKLQIAQESLKEIDSAGQPTTVIREFGGNMRRIGIIFALLFLTQLPARRKIGTRRRAEEIVREGLEGNRRHAGSIDAPIRQRFSGYEGSESSASEEDHLRT